MTNKQWAVIAVCILVLIGLFFAIKKWDVKSLQNQNSQIEKNDGSAQTEGEADKKSETYSSEVRKDAEISQSVVAVPAAPGAVSAKLRVFDLKITNAGFEPKEIVVNQGDTVNIRIKAEGGTFDMEIPDIGLYHSVGDGETKTMAFQAQVGGTFSFMCKDSCPKGGSTRGSLLVK